MSSTYDSILEGVRAAIAALDLSPLQAENVLVRALPRLGETVNTLPGAFICPAETGEDVEGFSFEDNQAYDVTYSVEVVMVSAVNSDYSLTSKPTLGWREKVRRAFQDHTLSGVEGVYKILIRTAPPYNRRLLAEQYAYSGLILKISNVEQRGN